MMKMDDLHVFYRDFNDPIMYHYKRIKNSVNGCPRYRVWFIDPEVSRVYEVILKGYLDINSLVADHIEKMGGA
jgi:hypothetical protein